ncbi:TPA: DUF2635 domain-containing protein [Pseudomonas putida]
MNLIHLKPAPGRDCPMPEKGGALLPVDGDRVPHNAYWQRRLDAGDALLVSTKKPAKESDA